MPDRSNRMPLAKLPLVNSINTSPFPSGDILPMVGLRAKLTAKILPARSQAGPSISAVKLCSVVRGRATKSSSADHDPGTVREAMHTPMTAPHFAAGRCALKKSVQQETIQYIACNPRDMCVRQQSRHPCNGAHGEDSSPFSLFVINDLSAAVIGVDALGQQQRVRG